MKSIVTVNPNPVLSIFDSMNGFMDNFFDDDIMVNHNMFGTLPTVDIKEDKEKYTLDMDLPGMTEKDVNLKLNDRTLTISSNKETKNEEKHEEKDENGTIWHVRERRSTSFSRSFTLPSEVNAEEIVASFKDGLLSIKLPKHEGAKEKNIVINKE